MNPKQHRTEWLIAAAGFAALLCCLGVYLADKPFDTWYDAAIVLCDLLLYAAVGVAFVWQWVALWRKAAGRERIGIRTTAAPEPPAGTGTDKIPHEAAPEPCDALQTDAAFEPVEAAPRTEPVEPLTLSPRDGWQTYAAIFLAMLGVHAARILLGYAWKVLGGDYGGTLFDSLSDWWGSDTRHYIDIAAHWYADYDGSGTVWRLVFLPFYSILIRLLQPLTGDAFAAGMTVSVLCSSAGGCVLYRLARLDHDRATARRAVKYYAILPAALFYTAALSEGTFVLLSLLCVLFARKKQWLPASVMGGLAAFTRSVGIILLVPVCFEWITALIEARGRDRKAWLWGPVLLLIPTGFGAYLLINHIETGSAWTFTALQRQNWSQQLGWFFHSVRYQLHYATDWMEDGKLHDTLGPWVPSLLSQFTALFAMSITARKQRASYTAYFLIYFAVAMGATWLLSAPRYLLVCFPLVLGMAILGKRRWVDRAMTAACLVLGQLYLYAFLFRFDVY